MNSASSNNRSDRFRSLWVAILLATLVGVIYLPTLRCGFIWDDDNYVTENLALRSALGFVDIWFNPKCTPQYYPLVHTSFWCEYQIWELNPSGYHVTNLVLHVLNAILIERVLRQIVPRYSLATAILFAIHPVHVESVAWITERKNLMSGVFYLLAANRYLRWRDASPSDATYPKLALLLYVAALLSKTVAVSLPVVLVIESWWQRGCFERREIRALASMIVVGIPFAVMTVWLEREHVGAIGSHWSWGIGDRCLIASQAWCFYPWKIIWPDHLAFVYAKWDIHSFAAMTAGVCGVLLLIIAGLTRSRAAVAILSIYSVTIFPALGFINIYPMRYTWVADHYQYLASVSLILGAIVLCDRLAVKMSSIVFRSDVSRSSAFGGILLPIVIVLGWRTSLESEKYSNPETLWADTLAKDRQCEMAWMNLGNYYRSEGRLKEAINCFRTALPLAHDDATAATNLAATSNLLGNRTEAIRQLQAITSQFARETWLAHFNLAVLLSDENQDEAALGHLAEAEKQAPREATIWNLRGLISLKKQDSLAAREHFRQAVKLRPYFIEARVNLGVALDRAGQTEDAIQEWDSVLALVPNHAIALKNRRAKQRTNR